MSAPPPGLAAVTAAAPDLRLAVPAAVAWGGAGILIGSPGVAFGVAALAWVLAAASWRRVPAVTLSFIALALLASLVGIRAPERETPSLVEAAASGGHVSVTVTIAESPRADRAVVAIDGGIPAVLFATLEPGVRIGSSVDVRGTVRQTAPGDSAAFLLRGDAVPTADPPWYLDWANGLRSQFADATADLPGRGAELLPGLAIGDTSRVSSELDAAMKGSSLSHLTAVSGANCAIVVGIILALGRLLGWSRRARTLVAALVLGAFVILVTPEPSVVRAAAMAFIVLGASVSGRPVRGVPVLALAVVVILCLDPWLARDYGFALSVLATGGLLVLARPLSALLGRWLPTSVSLVIAVPLAAQLCCQPVLVLLQPAIPTWGVLANVLAEPAAPAATVLGLAACVALPFAPWLGHALALLAWLPASWIAAVAQFTSTMPFAALPWPEGGVGLVLLAVPTGLAVAALLARRRWPLVLAVLVIVSLAGASAGGRLGVLLDRPSDWVIAMCDVGQGDAAVVRSEGLVALIDTGPSPAALRACLDDLSIAQIDLLVLSHFDLDHVGGTAAVFGAVQTVLVGPSSGADDDALTAQLERRGATVLPARRGDHGSLGLLRWQILWPRDRSTETGNPASVTIAFDCDDSDEGACLPAIFLGDLGEESQLRLAGAGALPPASVVKVAHHGSADQHPGFYTELGATVGLIGVGAENGYGHPTDAALDALEASGTRPLRTDRNGLILLSGQAGAVGVWTAR